MAARPPRHAGVAATFPTRELRTDNKILDPIQILLFVLSSGQLAGARGSLELCGTPGVAATFPTRELRTDNKISDLDPILLSVPSSGQLTGARGSLELCGRSRRQFRENPPPRVEN